MDWLPYAFWGIVIVAALVVVLDFWWRCVQATVRSLSREWERGKHEPDTTPLHDAEIEDD